MTPERRRQVEEIVYAALSRAESERLAFLVHTCAGDLVLRREVESLLAQQASTADFLDDPPAAVTASVVSDAGASLLTGRRLGCYQVHGRIAVGGMGEVYRASDTKLGRDVAIKILPRLFTSDPDRLARFEREARVLASLNHPHIGAIYGLEDADGVRALVLELVNGETLADRIARGPIPLSETLSIARQMADALEAAHEKGIVHRDLKPANIKITPDGVVKVLDFGLAKAASGDAAPADQTQSPAMTVSGTKEGVILGTAAYMSPEQARGRPADKRADVWAFGVVLYEMLTGGRPFEGETISDVLAKLIEREPDWTALPASTPSRLRDLLRRCAKKDPKRRLQAIGDARVQIEEVIEDASNDLDNSVTAAPSTAVNHRERVAWLIATALLLGVALFPAMQPSNSAPSSDPISFAVFPPGETAFSGSVNTTVNVPSFALSPDGRALVFSAQATGAKPTLWVRAMDSVGARQLAGTDDAQDPMWSPDSQWIGFFADGKLKKVPAAGGPVQVITQTATDFRGGTWGPDGTILFASGTDPIVSVNAGGSKVTPVTAFDPAHQEKVHRSPHFLPDGQHFLYSIMGHRDDQNGVYAGSLDGRTKKRLLHVNTSAVYVPPGYLLFADGDSLLGHAFDATSIELVGQPFLVATDGGRNTAFMSAVSASRTGDIAYAGIISQTGRLEWIDRAGTMLAPAGTPDGDYTDFRLSPDETQLASSLFDPKTNAVEIWLTDLVRSSRSRLSPGGLITASAVWSPDGTRLAFRTNRNGLIEFYERSAAGGGSDRTVLSAEAYQAAKMPSFNLVPTDWSPTGKQILFSAPTSASGSDLWLLPIGEGGTPAPFIASRAEQMHGNFSPNGGLVAYTSNESGRFEVYVETIPQSDRKWAVSANGGYEPRWRGDGGEIYYLSQDRKMMSVTVGAGPSFGATKPLFQTRVPAGVTNNRTHFVPSRDGNRFLVNAAREGSTTSINIIVNWAATINK